MYIYVLQVCLFTDLLWLWRGEAVLTMVRTWNKTRLSPVSSLCIYISLHAGS